ncbi:uncharacterized protein [Nicotiana tomentosiformis]|uniref:uncharacterized protein n=1 Tax=Nicotiana tomentosiformis TaxID=4098 RepID=UPI00388CA2A8
MRGHIQRECRASHQGASRGTTQSSSPTTATSSAPPLARGSPAPTGHGEARGGAQSSGEPNRFYALSGRQSAEASQDIVIVILTVQSHDVYALIDPGSSLSYVTPYVATSFGIVPEQLHEPFSVSTLVGEFIMVALVYKDCVVTVRGWDTTADLIELGLIDFDKAVKLQCSDACERSFQELKSRLTSVPVLTLPDGTEGFELFGLLLDRWSGSVSGQSMRDNVGA